MQFPVFPGPEFVNWELRRYKMLTKNEIFDWFNIYNYQFAVALFLVDSNWDSTTIFSTYHVLGLGQIKKTFCE